MRGRYGLVPCDVVVSGMNVWIGWLMGACMGFTMGWATNTPLNSKMPTCPDAGRPVMVEYYKDGSMVCTYQQLPNAVKTFKDKH